MTAQGIQLVFVYGALRRGARHAALMRAARFIGSYRTESFFTLYDLGAYPGAINGGLTSLQGEIYRVSPRLLNRLDRFEEVPALYDRVIMQTRYGACWIYLLIRKPSGARRIRHGDWLRHRGMISSQAKLSEWGFTEQ